MSDFSDAVSVITFFLPLSSFVLIIILPFLALALGSLQRQPQPRCTCPAQQHHTCHRAGPCYQMAGPEFLRGQRGEATIPTVFYPFAASKRPNGQARTVCTHNVHGSPPVILRSCGRARLLYCPVLYVLASLLRASPPSRGLPADRMWTWLLRTY